MVRVVQTMNKYSKLSISSSYGLFRSYLYVKTSVMVLLQARSDRQRALRIIHMMNTLWKMFTKHYQNIIIKIIRKH